MLRKALADAERLGLQRGQRLERDAVDADELVGPIVGEDVVPMASLVEHGAAVTAERRSRSTTRGPEVDLTMAFVGTRALVESAGFAQVADTRSVSDGFPRVVMRLAL